MPGIRLVPRFKYYNVDERSRAKNLKSISLLKVSRHDRFNIADHSANDRYQAGVASPFAGHGF